MRAILPGRPEDRLQAVSTGSWNDNRIITYISGKAIVVLDSPNHVLHTIYLDIPDELGAVAFDEISGKIAAASPTVVHVYSPHGTLEGALRWDLQCKYSVQPDDRIETLSWGLDEELLVGSSRLSLFSTRNSTHQVWSKPLGHPPKLALFSYDTSLIASTGRNGKLVKIWRRLSLADQRFEFDYLHHPMEVTAMHWRRPVHRDETFDNVLYTVCADNKMRIWVPGDSHTHHILHLWADIDLMEAIQIRTLDATARSTKRYTFMIDSRDFRAATEYSVQHASNDEEEQHAVAHLVEVANRTPEVCVILDEHGNMSAWGLESVGCKHRKPGDVFNIAHAEGLRLSFDPKATSDETRVQFHAFCKGKGPGKLNLLAHHFDGRIEWFEGRLDQLFDLSPRKNRLTHNTTWTGHSGTIKKVVRTATGRAILSRTASNESIVWAQRNTKNGMTISRQSSISITKHIHRVWLLQEGNFIVFLHHDGISLWDARQPHAAEVGRRPLNINGKPLCLLFIPDTTHDNEVAHLATITSEMKVMSWGIRLPTGPDAHNCQASIEDFDSFDLGLGDELAYVLPVDPAGTAPVISGFLDTFARDVAVSYTKSGVLRSWTARADRTRRKLEWLLTATVETSIENPALGSATSIRKAALVNADRTQLTIWSTKGAQLEYEAQYSDHGIIQDLDWSSTPDNQSILAVGFPHRIIVYGQLRFDYLDSYPSWAALREINTRDFCPHPIGDSVWLGNGNLVIGAGHQLFVQNEKIDVSQTLLPDLRLTSKEKLGLHMFSLVSRLNGSLPIFHPQYLAQCVLCGKLMLVERILLKLWNTLKFYSEGDHFDSMLEFSPEDFWKDEKISASVTRREMGASYTDFTEEEPETVTEESAAKINELLRTRQVPLLSSREQFHLADIIECVGTVEKHRRSIDENGCRFLLFFRQYVLRQSQHLEQPKNISWREITWAFHSESQDILADLVSRHFQNKMLWQHARESGLFMWLTDINALRSQFEMIGRNEYTKSENKNPVDCSLYYLALRKKTVLIGLWRIAYSNPERIATQRLLLNNFNDEHWKTVALKNAYALMGKRRFDYAAAWFLLADHLKDAVAILANQLDDVQLAITVARVYEGDDGPVLREFLKEKVLPLAAIDNNRWLATWALWMLGKRDRAVRALVLPLNDVVSPPDTPHLTSKLFTTTDPALVVHYKQLREKSLQTLRGALSISPSVEWEFVLQTARIYDRMGCDLLALDLVRTWEFLQTQPTLSVPDRRPSSPIADLPSSLNLPKHSATTATFPGSPGFDPRKFLRRRGSMVVADLPMPEEREEGVINGMTNGRGEEGEEKNHEEGGEEEGEKEKQKSEWKRLMAVGKPPPQPSAQARELDPNSLLDAFGF